MAGLGSRWAALSGRRFLLRRMDYAILGRSMPAVGDPLRAESLALPVGCLLALALLVGSAAMAVLRPAAGPGGAPLVLARGSGALFVRVGQDLRPVANMASARLILNEPAQPRVVDDDRLGPVSSGPVLGIPGAPQRIDRILGLELAADDYLMKPFNPRELIARITEADLRELHAHIQAEREAVQRIDVPTRTKLLFDFHVKLAQVLGNQVLTDLMQELVSRCSLISLMYQSADDAETSNAEHVDILQAIEARDANRAVQLLHEHLATVERQLTEHPRTAASPVRAKTTPT